VRRDTPRPIVVHGEDHRNLASLIEPGAEGGWGLDGVWADDFHHIVRRLLAGDGHGYYEDFEGTTEELARTIRHGWLYTGQHSAHGRCSRGTDAAHVPMDRFVVCLQNHDQVGNRASGDRLHHRIDAAAWRAASTILLTAPMTPLLFMGQEWAASTPFQFFTDLEPELGRMVTEGRRHEFREFPDFATPGALSRVPDPQAETTFTASTLDWHERAAGVHAATLALYTDLLHLRRNHAALGGDSATSGDAEAVDAGAIVVRRQAGEERFLIAARLTGRGPVRASAPGVEDVAAALVLSTEDARYALDPAPAGVTIGRGELAVDFQRPGAVIVRVG
jgi:maltooligosyltrehalose trehalohydrolase